VTITRSRHSHLWVGRSQPPAATRAPARSWAKMFDKAGGDPSTSGTSANSAASARSDSSTVAGAALSSSTLSQPPRVTFAAATASSWGQGSTAMTVPRGPTAARNAGRLSPGPAPHPARCPQIGARAARSAPPASPRTASGVAHSPGPARRTRGPPDPAMAAPTAAPNPIPTRFPRWYLAWWFPGFSPRPRCP
jgi:hypothetical protein